LRLRRRHLRERARIHLCHNRGAASCGFARCDHDDRLPPLPSATLNRSNPARHPALLLFILHPSHFILLSAAFCLLPSAFCLLLSPGPEGRKILAHRVSRGIRSASKSSPAPAGAKDIGTTRAAWFVEKGHEFTRAEKGRSSKRIKTPSAGRGWPRKQPSSNVSPRPWGEGAPQSRGG